MVMTLVWMSRRPSKRLFSLDRDEDDAGLGDGVEHGDDFAEGAAEAGELADDEAVAGLKRGHELVKPPAQCVGAGGRGALDEVVDAQALAASVPTSATETSRSQDP